MNPSGLVIALLNYIEQLEKLKIKPAFEIPREPFVAHEHELRQLPELRYNLQSDGDDVWLRLPRVEEIPAPEPEEGLLPWISLSKEPSNAPDLRQSVPSVESPLLLEDHPQVRESFDWYVEHLWSPWSATELLRRQTRALYNRLFALHQLMASEGSESPVELVWGIGFATWKKPGRTEIVRHPLITQACEITLNPKTYELEIRPRDKDPKLELDCYAAMDVLGVRSLEIHWKATLATASDRLNPFDEGTFAGTLQAAVSHLDAGGSFRTGMGNAPHPSSTQHLQITDAWVVFARKRTPDILLQDIEKLRQCVAEATELPPVVRGLVSRGADTVQINPELPFRGLSTSEASPGAFELYFPMPYNDEQVSIVGKLQNNDGVVVQGPPGTGKTHTIANIICHYLAQGKRVLITAKGESALAVLQDKLPEKIRALSVALLANDREGVKQFERSIQQIASTVTAYIPTRAAKAIQSAETDLDRLHGKIATVDREISEAAAEHLRTYDFQGQALTAEDLAKQVVTQASTHAWFDDEVAPKLGTDLPFDFAEIATLKRCRIEVGESLLYLNHSLPQVGDLPSAAELVSLHQDLIKARGIQEHIETGELLPLINAKVKTFERARALIPFLTERNEIRQQLTDAALSWTTPLLDRIRSLDSVDPVLEMFFELCGEAEAAEGVRRQLLAKAVAVPEGAEHSDDFREALRRLLVGQRAFLLPIGKTEARKLLGATTVGGADVSTTEGWRIVDQVIRWRDDARKLAIRWRVVAGELMLDAPPDGSDQSIRQMANWAACTKITRRLATEFESPLKARVEEVFGESVAVAIAGGDDATLEHAIRSLRSHVERNKLSYAIERVAGIRSVLAEHSGAVVTEANELLAKIGTPESTDLDLHASWSAIFIELDRLSIVRPALDEIRRVCTVLHQAGAPNWALRLSTQPAEDLNDTLIPDTWLMSWRWRQASVLLDRIDTHQQLRKLFEQRKSLTTRLERAYQEIVAEKAWLGVFNNSPEVVRKALQRYLNAIQSLGAGTGVRSGRYRKNAREAMEDAYKAVPCWILPHWRVSEAIPAELGLFDLVVVDEASQSDISALPALLRGKKLLVVGDHKQVSPSAVGVAEAHILDLSQRFLTDQPHGSEMTPEKSIYDLARVLFAGNSVMLKEHFRSVPAIIEFSNRTFYGGDIKPLRIAKANERLDPPLIDVFVKGGVRNGKEVNEAEACAVVDEIQSMLEDPTLAGRSIGVVTLLGHKQAERINSLINQRITQLDIVEREIAVGPPPVFQGRERDIMLVSMVIGHGDSAVATRADMEQRFNVALSRARDRMVLFRSVLESEMRDNSLNSLVLQHFKQPFRQDPRTVENLRSLCESDFEREMFDELVKRGYRVTPQVRSSSYRIDFVVEGHEGRRLAVECDGDRWHGPDQWRDDMQRQRILERAGWTFWRCFGSSFARKRQEVLDDLMTTLTHLGIDPIGGDTLDTSAWVAYKEVDPLEVGENDSSEETDDEGIHVGATLEVM
jgi:very-short-patch-repair endonuclease/KaiC/GvpD/RAD55 family RecA-like ATPase